MSISTIVGKASFYVVKHAPTILTAIGVTSLSLAVVSAPREYNEGVEAYKRLRLDSLRIREGRKEYGDELYPRSARVMDRAKVYTAFVVETAMAYKKTILLSSVGIAAITFGHALITRRFNSAVAAYSALDAAFSNYRKGAAKILGAKGVQKLLEERLQDTDELDLDGPEGPELFWNDAEFEGKPPSPYARLFAPHTTQTWNSNHQMNLSFLAMQQSYFNEILNARGHLFLNEVYEALGLSHTPAGALCGWIKDNPEGDGYVDFITCLENEFFINHPHNPDDVISARSIFIDFNTDGEIWDRI